MKPNYVHQWKLLSMRPGFEMHWCKRCGAIRYTHAGEATIYLEPGRLTDPDTNGNIPPCKES